MLFCFVKSDTACTELYTLPLHDALPISSAAHASRGALPDRTSRYAGHAFSSRSRFSRCAVWTILREGGRDSTRYGRPWILWPISRRRNAIRAFERRALFVSERGGRDRRQSPRIAACLNATS